MNKEVNILLVEDYKLIRVGIKTLLDDTEGFNVVAEAESGREAIQKVQQYKPDIILLDLGLPDMKGTKVISEIQNLNINTKIIVLSAHDSKEEIDRCISNGVYAYVIKDINTESLVNVIKTVNDGAMWFDPKIVPILRLNHNGILSTGKISRKIFKSTHSNLTQREFEVLKLIVDGKSNQDIAKELCISEHTAKAHVCNIIQKLVVDDRTQAAVKAVKEGIIQ